MPLTMQISVPALYCPFPSNINPLVKKADMHTADWLRSFQLVQSSSVLNYYRKQGFAYMVSRMFPNADSEMLYAFTDLNTLLFLIDDQFDHQTDRQENSIPNVNDLQGFIKGFISVLEKDCMVTLASDGPVYAALNNFWHRVRKRSTVRWQERFIKGIKDIFDAALWQYKNVLQQRTVLYKEYIDKRQYLGAANVATDTIELAEAVYLPELILESEIVQRITELCRNSVCWANDLFSLSKEIKHEDDYNLVIILQKQLNLSLEDAIIAAAGMHDRDVKEFVALSGSALNTSDAHTEELRRYINALSAIMKGNIDWSRNETTRYNFVYVEEL